MAKKTSWLLAVVICIGLPAALNYYGLALAAATGLAVLAWRAKLH